jgi:hypothetical protein
MVRNVVRNSPPQATTFYEDEATARRADWRRLRSREVRPSPENMSGIRGQLLR